jgi:S-DNA-T family DNA segregation ATPase FtsK/SpoIIIE
LEELGRVIVEKLESFKVNVTFKQAHPGPLITLFEFEPHAGVKLGRITALVDDLALGIRRSPIRIVAPIPGRGTVGIEVPNDQFRLVRFRELIESQPFQEAASSLAIPLGVDTRGDFYVADIARMPHLLIAGATGTGKSVCVNSILSGLLYRASPDQLRLIMIDPKVLELSIYEGIPHLAVPVVTEPKRARIVLQWAVGEMERRYRVMQQLAVRNIDNFNERLAEGGVWKDADGQPLEEMPKIVIVIDELADLMLQVGREIEELITRLAQKARAAGIHLIVATQRPSVDVITGLIKANFPARVSFRVSSRIDSRTIIDSMGAERLLGRGDMLFLQPGATTLRRLHGPFLSDEEVDRIVKSVRKLGEPNYEQDIVAYLEQADQEDPGSNLSLEVELADPYYEQAKQLVISKQQASTSMIQRAFRIGYNRAARIIDMLERDNVVGPTDGVRPREVRIPDLNDCSGDF